MSFIDYVSERIIARGYDYFESDMVLEVEQTDTYEYRGLVKGSRNEPYSVMINTKNHKAAVCDCPYEKCRALFEEIDLAAGRREPSIRFHYRYRSKW